MVVVGRVGLGVAVGCAAVACAIAVTLVGKRISIRRRWARAVSLLEEFEEGCSTPVARVKQVVDAIAVEMHAGLASDGGSKLKMSLTYVDTLPTGNEKGTYYALDMGGDTGFKVICVQLGGDQSTLRHKVEQHEIPQNLRTGAEEELFDFIAVTLKNFIEKDSDGIHNKPNRSKRLGFAASFPIKQQSVCSGILIKCTKGFTNENTVGKDVAQCLQDALFKRGLDMQVVALVNDSVGTLAFGHYHDEDTVAAVVFGTETNACYVEHIDAIIKCHGLLTNSGCMVINTEWGYFWSSHLPRTSYDIDVDEQSSNRNDQGFDKMISGMYLGEIVRRVLLRMDQDSGILGEAALRLSEDFILRTPLMAAMHEDDTHDLQEVGRILSPLLQMPDVPLKVRRLVIRVCDVVVHRAARLAAAGIVGILKKIGRDGSNGVASGRSRGSARRTVVAVGGYLYSSYSAFHDYLNEALVEILGMMLPEMLFSEYVRTDRGSVLPSLLHHTHRNSASST